MQTFEAFQKIARLKRECVITEKIDGTNAQICIGEDGEFQVGSRTRWITPEEDNYGFAKWAFEHRDELMLLGPGRHYGIGEKRLSLFNVGRWNDDNRPPSCCSTVPLLYQGAFSTETVDAVVERLRAEGSVASPGFMKAEGVIVYLPAARELFKVTLEKDEQPKSLAA